MFACQNFLKKSCRKCYKEQKLFHVHLMKMITTCSKSAYKADLGAVLALSKSWRHQFAWSVLETSYLFIQADLVFALADKLVELD